MTQELQNQKEEKMLGSFNGKLDKSTCMVSLFAISLIMLVVVSSDLFSVFNISGVFKQ